MLTFFQWSSNDFFVQIQSADNIEPLCLPFFPNCDLFLASIEASAWRILLYVYLFDAVVCALAFLAPAFSAIGQRLLLGLTFLKFLFLMSNYNLMSGLHGLTILIPLIYIFASQDKGLIKRCLLLVGAIAVAEIVALRAFLFNQASTLNTEPVSI